MYNTPYASKRALLFENQIEVKNVDALLLRKRCKYVQVKVYSFDNDSHFSCFCKNSKYIGFTFLKSTKRDR